MANDFVLIKMAPQSKAPEIHFDREVSKGKRTSRIQLIDAKDKERLKLALISDCSKALLLAPPKVTFWDKFLALFGVIRWVSLKVKMEEGQAPRWVKVNATSYRLRLGMTDNEFKNALRVHKNSRDFTEYALAKVQSKEVSTETVDITKPLKEERIELKNADYPKGCTQYTYPSRKPNENIPQACSFHSANAILVLKEDFDEIYQALDKQDKEYLITMQRKIIDRGLKDFDTSVAKGRKPEAIHPEEVGKYIPKLKTLQLDKGKVEVTFIEDLGPIGSIDTELNRLFAKDETGKKRFSLVESDGQSFTMYMLNDQQALLYDPHKSMVAVVSKEQAKKYLTGDILHFENKPQQWDATFFHGSL